MYTREANKTWKVVPLCDKQLRDVNPADVLHDGLYRKCNIYKGGGGYDKFEEIYKGRTGSWGSYNNQFVVQLYGCVCNCPYCYVTPDGVFGDYVEVPTWKLVDDFFDSGLDVFHLMGGSPALYIDDFPELIDSLTHNTVFHSDLLLVESLYKEETLRKLSGRDNCLYAVSVKGCDSAEFKKNTGKDFNEPLFWENLKNLCAYKIPFYLTFTGMSCNSIDRFKSKLMHRMPDLYHYVLQDSFSIEIVKYKALEE